jgi:hypothetical protein
MTYFSLHISRINKDLHDIKERDNKDNKSKKVDVKLKKTKIRKNNSMDDFMKIQWPWLF